MRASRVAHKPPEIDGGLEVDASGGLGVVERLVASQGLVPVGERVVVVSEAAPGRCPVGEQIRFLGRLGHVDQRHGLLEVAQGIFEPGGPHGLAPGQAREAEQPAGLGGRAGLGEVVGDLGGRGVEAVGVAAFQGVGHQQVEAPATGLGQRRQQRLADQLVGEQEPVLVGGAREWGHEPGPFGLVEGAEEGVGGQFTEGLEELVGEGPPDDGGGGERPAPVVPQAFQAPAEHQAQALRDAKVVDVDHGEEPSALVEQAALLGEVLEDLLGEEGVALGLGVDRGHERRRRLLPGQRGQQGGDAVLREAFEADRLGPASAQQALERTGEGMGGRDLGVAIGPHRQHRQPGESLGQVLDEEEGALIGPMQVVEDEEQRPGGGGPGQDVAEAVEEVVPLLLRRKLQRRRDVGEEPAEAGQQLGHLGRVVAEEGPERLWIRCDGQGLLQDLDEGHVGRRTLDLVAPPDEDPEPLGGGVGGDLLTEACLPDTGFAAHKGQASRAPVGAVDEATELGPLRLAAHIGGTGGKGRRGGRRPLLPPPDLEEPEPVGEAFEPVPSPVGEGQLRATAGQLADHLRDEDLPAGGPGSDPCRGVDRLTVEIVRLGDDLAGVHPDADLEIGEIGAPLGQRPLDGHGAGQGPPGRSEGHHEPVPQRLDLHAAIGGHLGAHHLLVASEELLGGMVAVAGAEVGGGFDVGEEDGDRAAGQGSQVGRRCRPRRGRGSRRRRRRFFRAGGWAPLQVRGLAQDGGLQRHQGRTRLEADLLGQQSPQVPVHPQRLHLTAGPVEGQHALTPEPFAQRVLPG